MHDDPYRGFLASCLSTNEGGHQPTLPSQFPRWNWDKFVQTAADETVLSAMRDSLTLPGLAHELPVDVFNLFLTVKQLNCERNKSILSDLKWISGLFNKVGIEPVVLERRRVFTPWPLP
jgi:hypothetical protein